MEQEPVGYHPARVGGIAMKQYQSVGWAMPTTQRMVMDPYSLGGGDGFGVVPVGDVVVFLTDNQAKPF